MSKYYIYTYLWKSNEFSKSYHSGVGFKKANSVYDLLKCLNEQKEKYHVTLCEEITKEQYEEGVEIFK